MLQTDLYWSHLRWQPEAHVITVNHDDSTNHAGAHAKARLVHKLAHACLIQELSAKCLCKVGPQIVCGTCLNTSRSDRQALTPSDNHQKLYTNTDTQTYAHGFRGCDAMTYRGAARQQYVAKLLSQPNRSHRSTCAAFLMRDMLQDTWRLGRLSGSSV